MCTIVAVILMFQAGMNHSATDLDIPELENSQAIQAANQERDLMQRYNRLARALNEFVASYKAGKIDLKKANAARKALHDMEKFEWLRPQRPAAGARTDVEN